MNAGPVVVGYDGSPESRAASAWAAREARLRGCPLELLQAWPWPVRDVVGSDEVHARSREQLAARAAELRTVAVGVDVICREVRTEPAEALETAARDAALLVLGSRGLGTVHGFLVGSVGREVLGRTTRPVVLVRAEEDGRGATGGPVLAGLDLEHPADEMLAFAFSAAALRRAPVRVLHVWSPPAGSEYMAFDAIGGLEDDLSAAERTGLAEALRPWRERFPDLDVTADLVRGTATIELVAAAAAARLVVLGHRIRHRPLGAHLGPVARAAIHHVHCPVAIVPHR
ncbi:universal stress protein [Kitasatospora sp. NPDC101176]|uniref:universal stress protein n=1 Tax=Kitasatospora sp. NPDC101176 TaxID=3364099 RepID=UPI0038272651